MSSPLEPLLFSSLPVVAAGGVKGAYVDGNEFDNALKNFEFFCELTLALAAYIRTNKFCLFMILRVSHKFCVFQMCDILPLLSFIFSNTSTFI